MPVVGRQQKNLKCLLDECASRWRTTEKLAVKGELIMLRYYYSPFKVVVGIVEAVIVRGVLLC